MRRMASAPCACASSDLQRVDEEILAQHRQPDRLPHLHEIQQAALEKIGIGEHRDGLRARLFIITGDGDRIEVLADHTLGRRGLFHLGDDRYPVIIEKGLPKTPRWIDLPIPEGFGQDDPPFFELRNLNTFPFYYSI